MHTERKDNPRIGKKSGTRKNEAKKGRQNRSSSSKQLPIRKRWALAPEQREGKAHPSMERLRVSIAPA